MSEKSPSQFTGKVEACWNTIFNGIECLESDREYGFFKNDNDIRPSQCNWIKKEDCQKLWKEFENQTLAQVEEKLKLRIKKNLQAMDIISNYGEWYNSETLSEADIEEEIKKIQSPESKNVAKQLPHDELVSKDTNTQTPSRLSEDVPNSMKTRLHRTSRQETPEGELTQNLKGCGRLCTTVITKGEKQHCGVWVNKKGKLPIRVLCEKCQGKVKDE